MVGLVAFSPALLHAEDTKPATSGNRPSREELREQWKNLTPEQREARIKEWREKNPGGPSRSGDPRGPAAEKFREERKELAKQIGLDAEELKNLSPEERMKKVREASEAKVTELKKKKEAGTISDDEQKLLGRLEQLKKGAEDFRRRQENGGPRPGDRKPGDRPRLEQEKKKE